eukprot:TRINITY_DN32038_c0_g1_i1.p1 TRINITY_DN32038_c0_g1~~TRINITY_DN32038_c0_g1_i1.p1  ORF type:complete len:1263 (-),score=281.51 TRINITY_DN32038_c0_g1_i1:128-3916(-)
MGCCSSSADSQSTIVEATGSEAKRYFKLSGLPVSVSAHAASNGLDLTVVGLDCQEALLQLEVAVRQRGFKIDAATLIWQGDLTDQRFHLHYVGKFENDKQEVASKKSEVNVRVTCDFVKAQDAVAMVPECRSVIADANVLLKVTLQGEYSFGMRAGCIHALRKADVKLVAASFNSSGAKHCMMMEDTLFGFKPDVPVAIIQSIVLSALFQTASVPENKPQGEFTPLKVYSAQTASQLVSAINEVDKGNLQCSLKGLPSALQGALKGVNYAMKGPTTNGFQIESCVKYIGAGLTKFPFLVGSPSHSETPILQLRTVFIRSNASGRAESDKKVKWLKKLMNVEKEYAEFVTFLDLSSKTFVIFKAFLNNLVASGHGYGARAIAEHLLEAPGTFFSAASGAPPAMQSEPQQAEEWPSWLPSLINSIPDLEVIHICDVVNWNTYVIMCLAVQEDRKEAIRSRFGAEVEWAVRGELRRSELTEQSLVASSQLQLFESTNLGKVVMMVLKHLNSHLGIHLQASGVEVLFGTHHEYIMGQTEKQMDIKVFIKRGDEGSSLKAGIKKVASGEALNQMSRVMSKQHAPLPLGDHFDFDFDADFTERITQSLTPPKAYAPQVAHSLQAEATPKSSALRKEDVKMDLGNLGVGSQVTTVTSGNSGQVMGLSSAACLLGLASSMLNLIHSLQWERALSCKTVGKYAACAEEGEKVAKTQAKLDLAVLEQQWEITNEQLSQILTLLEKLWSPNAVGDQQEVFQKGVASFQNVSVKVLMQQQVVKAVLMTPPADWVERYVLCCHGATGYTNQLEILMDWLTSAVHSLTLVASVDMAQLRQEFILLAAFKEQLGRERAFLCAKAHSRWSGSQEEEDILQEMSSGRQQLHGLLGLGEDSECSSKTWDVIPPILAQLREMESAWRRELAEPSFSVSDEDVETWFEEMNQCMNSIGFTLSEMCEQLRVQPEDSRCLPTNLTSFSSHNDVIPGNVGSALEVMDMEFTLELVEKLRDRHFTRIVALVGAGISVSANLPDFRSPGGLYDQLKQEGFSCPEVVFTRSFMEEQPALFYTVMEKLQTDDVEPTPTHHFLRVLHDKGMLLRCHTQNIDGLERKAGLPAERIVEAHGTMLAAKCLSCNLPHETKELWAAKPSENIFPRCRSCKSLIRPDIVFFGEDLPQRFRDLAMQDLRQADLVLVIGTSLSVQPFASLVHEAKRGCPRLIMNLSVPGALKARPWKKIMSGPQTDAFLLGKCDQGVEWFSRQLGWERELLPSYGFRL